MKKPRNFRLLLMALFLCLAFAMPAYAQDAGDGAQGDGTSQDGGSGGSSQASIDVNNVIADFGMDLLEDEIDEVIFQTNGFLTDATFSNAGDGPFWWILQICEALAGIFCICLIANMGFKMMAKGEGIDILKLLRPLAVSVVLALWYPGPDRPACVMDFLAYAPNCIGSYTKQLYLAESVQLQATLIDINRLIQARDDAWEKAQGQVSAAVDGITEGGVQQQGADAGGPKAMSEAATEANTSFWKVMVAGGTVMIDKIIMLIALVTYRIGWWATIYIQQIMLGMLTIFGPIQWVFSILPKWEGAWAKWTIRYLTVHFYGAMIYFVGFYVLLLFDVVLALQKEQLNAAFGPGAPEDAANGYFQSCLFSAGYLMAASVVAVKCLALVPDLAAWMIPEGETSFSARSFGQDVGQQVGGKATSVMNNFVKGR